MLRDRHAFAFFLTSAAASLFVLFPQNLSAHCDGLDGPVVIAAKRALETGNVNYALIWVQEKNAEEIKDAFKKTMTVRELGDEAKNLADFYFFETLVRIHRQGEGAPYTGLKPAGRDLGPAIPASDQAIETGKMEPVLDLLKDEMTTGIHEQFGGVMAKKDFDPNDVETGQEYVEAYVQFIHYVERIFQATQMPANGHYPERQKHSLHQEEH